MLEAERASGQTWEELFAERYAVQTCRYTGETFRRLANSAHAARVNCANGKDEGWHVSTLCPPELDPNVQKDQTQFILDIIRGPRKHEFLFHFPALCSPIVQSFQEVVHDVQAAYNDLARQGLMDPATLEDAAQYQYPKYADLLVEMFSERRDRAERQFAAMSTAHLRRLLGNPHF
eukprot:EG_transcript_26603